jgi:hypothetical protein
MNDWTNLPDMQRADRRRGEILLFACSPGLVLPEVVFRELPMVYAADLGGFVASGWPAA